MKIEKYLEKLTRLSMPHAAELDFETMAEFVGYRDDDELERLREALRKIAIEMKLLKSARAAFRARFSRENAVRIMRNAVRRMEWAKGNDDG